ncbi:hypothetical protein B0H11DRAFT_2276429, partial [Mycena galericulata]
MRGRCRRKTRCLLSYFHVLARCHVEIGLWLAGGRPYTTPTTSRCLLRVIQWGCRWPVAWRSRFPSVRRRRRYARKAFKHSQLDLITELRIFVRLRYTLSFGWRIKPVFLQLFGWRDNAFTSDPSKTATADQLDLLLRSTDLLQM